MGLADVTLREVCLADAYEAELDRLKADLKASRQKTGRLVDMCRAKDSRIKALETALKPFARKASVDLVTLDPTAILTLTNGKTMVLLHADDFLSARAALEGKQ